MSIKILYYVVIAMQLQIIISFNTYSSDTTSSHTIVSDSKYDNSNINATYNDTVNNSNTNDIIDAELNNIIHDTTEESFITHWHLWDSSQPWGGYIDISLLFSFNIINLYLPLGKFSPHVKLFYGKGGIKITKSKFNRPYSIYINVNYIKTLFLNLFVFRNTLTPSNPLNQDNVNNQNNDKKNHLFTLDPEIDWKHFKGWLFAIYHLAMTNFDIDFYALDNITLLKIKYKYNMEQQHIEKRCFKLCSLSSLLQLLGYNIMPKWLNILQLNYIYNTFTNIDENEITTTNSTQPLGTWDIYFVKIKIEPNLILFNSLGFNIYLSNNRQKNENNFMQNENIKTRKTKFYTQVKIKYHGIYVIDITNCFKDSTKFYFNFMDHIMIYYNTSTKDIILGIKIGFLYYNLPLNPIIQRISNSNNSNNNINNNSNTNEDINNQLQGLMALFI